MATQSRLMTGIGYTSGWTASSGGNKWEDIDDPIGTPDDDATYIYKADSDGYQAFTFSAFAIDSSAITSVSITARTKKLTATSYISRLYLRVGGTNYSQDVAGETTSYVDYTKTWTQNPQTTADWLEADVEGTGANPLQQAMIGTSGLGAGEQINCTQMYITVTYTEAGGLSIPVAIAGAWKDATPQILIDGAWKAISGAKILIDGAWKDHP